MNQKEPQVSITGRRVRVLLFEATRRRRRRRKEDDDLEDFDFDFDFDLEDEERRGEERMKLEKKN